MFGNELEKLLEALFEDDDESISGDITVLAGYIRPLETLGNCCRYNYAAYNG